MSKKTLASGCPPNTGNPLGVWQDFTTYVEFEQTGNPLTVWDFRIRAINMANNKKDYVSKAIAGIGVDSFSCHTSVYMNGGGGQPSYALLGACVDATFPFGTTGFLGIRLIETSTYKRLQLIEKYGTLYNYGGFITIPAAAWAHFRIRVDRSVGVHGTMYLQLFTDNEFTTAVGAGISLPLAATNFMTHWHGLSNGYIGVARNWTGYVDNTWLIYGV